MEDNKILLIKLLEKIREQTDEENPISQTKLEAQLGLDRSKRKTTASYLRILCDSKLCKRKVSYREDGSEYTLGYFAVPEFSNSEVQQLIYHILFTRNMSENEKYPLIAKLKKLTRDVEYNDSLKKLALPNSLPENQVKRLSETIEAINWAINSKENIRIVTKDEDFVVAPYTLIMKNDNWYLICLDHDSTRVIPLSDIVKARNLIDDKSSIDDSAIFMHLNIKNQKVSRYLEMNPDMEDGTIVLATVWLSDIGYDKAVKYFGSSVVKRKRISVEKVYTDGGIYEINAVDTCIEKFALANLGEVHILSPEIMRINFIKRINKSRKELLRITSEVDRNASVSFTEKDEESSILMLNSDSDWYTRSNSRLISRNKIIEAANSVVSKFSKEDEDYQLSVLPGSYVDKKLGELVSFTGTFINDSDVLDEWFLKAIEDKSWGLGFGVAFAEIKRIVPDITIESKEINHPIGKGSPIRGRVVLEEGCLKFMEDFCKENSFSISIAKSDNDRYFLIVYGRPELSKEDLDEIKSNRSKLEFSHKSSIALKNVLIEVLRGIHGRTRMHHANSINELSLKRSLIRRDDNQIVSTYKLRRGAISARLEESVIVSGINKDTGEYEYVVGEGVGNMDYGMTLPSHVENLESVINLIDSPIKLKEIMNVGGHRRV